MSETAPKGIYVYQPYGAVSHPDRAKTGRLYGLGGLPAGVECKGLTKDEAEAFADAMNDICWMMEDCPACGHHLSSGWASACPQCGADAPPPWGT